MVGKWYHSSNLKLDNFFNLQNSGIPQLIIKISGPAIHYSAMISHNLANLKIFKEIKEDSVLKI